MEKIVIKIGTSTLTQGANKLSRRYMLSIAQQIALLHSQGKKVVLVSSGAITAGKELLNTSKPARSLPSKQMFSSVGQVKLMQLWSDLFSIFDIQVGQLLLTRDDFSNRKRHLNARDTLFCLFQHGVVPIINENDSIATTEIRVGDNDNLAAFVGNLIAADKMILLTDQEGLYTKDPRLHADATLIPHVSHVDDKILALAGKSSTEFGTGGMITKIEAAKFAAQSGIETTIASANIPDILLHIVNGKEFGTTFKATTTSRESRKRWLLSERPEGKITVDDGASTKIFHHGASLLPSGITSTSSDFERGAIVIIKNSHDKPIGIGITNYSSEEIQKLIGEHSDSIEDILGYTRAKEIIHRSNMTRIHTQEDVK